MAPRPLSLNFSGPKARERREKLGFSLSKLAARCEEFGHKVHKSAISKVECGTNKPSPELLKAMANALGCTVDALLDENPEAAA